MTDTPLDLLHAIASQMEAQLRAIDGMRAADITARRPKLRDILGDAYEHLGISREMLREAAWYFENRED